MKICAMADFKRVLLVAGASYIGSHVAVSLLQAGHHVKILDNSSHSSPEVIDNIRRISNRPVEVVKADLRNRDVLEAAFAATPFDTVVLLAGLKLDPDSATDPVHYYDVNVGGAIALLEAMQKNGCHQLVFSSSTTVYGNHVSLPINEDHPIQPTNPNGTTNAAIEGLIQEHSKAYPNFSAMILRYFNPVGAYASGLIDEHPKGVPGNLFPCLGQAYWNGESATVFGTDFDTPDGTGMRVFIHVEDLAEGHVQACEFVGESREMQLTSVNPETGRAFSVRQVIESWNAIVGNTIDAVETHPRPGDIEACWADPTRSEMLLDWKARRDLTEMCASHWASFVQLKGTGPNECKPEVPFRNGGASH